MKPFRFGLMTYWINIHPKNWIRTVQHIEELGYSTVFEADHFKTHAYDPMVTLSAAASTTKKLNIGTLVFDVDYRHPAILARAAAALHLLSKGRFEFGIGAGWDVRDYEMSGIQFDRPRTRIKRLDEALHIIRSMWTKEKTTFHGEQYKITEMAKAGDLPEGEYPKILVGGGGKRLLTVAGRHADIVGIQWRLSGGRWSGLTIRETTLDQVKRRIEWVKDSARRTKRDPESIELQMLFPDCMVTDDPEPKLKDIAKENDVSLDDVRECPQWLIGSGGEIREKLKMLREETDINYMVFGPTDIDQIDVLAKDVVARLT